MSLTDGYLELLGRCECCGRYFPETELHDVDCGLMIVCEDCFQDLLPDVE